MAAQHGKIARLPFDIREQINNRIINGEPANKIVPWLNALPAVQAIISDQFNGVPISEQNISNWRTGGILQWAGLRDWRAICRASVEDASQITATGFGAKHLLVLLTARIAAIYDSFDGEHPRHYPEITPLLQLAATLLKIHQSEQKDARLALDRERLDFDRQNRSAKPAAPEENQPPVSSPAPQPRPSPPNPGACAPPPPAACLPPTPNPTLSPAVNRFAADSVPATHSPRPAVSSPSGNPEYFGILQFRRDLSNSSPRTPATSEIPADLQPAALSLPSCTW